MGSPFKMNPKTPLMKALVGKQKNLPEHLKKAILAAPESPAKSYGKSPMKKEGDAKASQRKTLAEVGKGEYTKIRDYTPDELIAQVKKRGVSSAQIKKEIADYRAKSQKVRSSSKAIANSGTQMAEILTEGGAGGERGIAEAAKKRSAGKSPAQMKGVAGLKKKSKGKAPAASKGMPKAPNAKMQARVKRVGKQGSPAKMKGDKTKQANSGIGPKAKIEKGKNTTPKMKQSKAQAGKNYKTGKSPAKMKGVKALKKK